MNIFFQIGLGLLPGTVAAIILLIKRRAFRFGKIGMVLLLTLGCGAMLFYGGMKFIGDGGIAPRLSEKKTIAFANALAGEGAYEEAYEVLDEYSSHYGYDNHCRLLNARIALLKGDYESASGLYRYLSANTDVIGADAEEVVFASKKGQNTAADLVMIGYLKEVGENIADYGYTEDSYEEIRQIEETSLADIQKIIEDEVEKKYSVSDEAKDCAKAVAGITDTYADFTQDGENATGKYRRAFREIEENAPEYLSLDCVNKARIKSNVLSGDFDTITKELTSDSSYHELMISAELYMSGLVQKTDFSDEYQGIDRADASAVKTRLNRVYQENQKDLTVQERNVLKARVNAVTSQLSDSALVTIKEQLTDVAETEAGTDRTKVYLELAKIEDYFGNETSTDSCISSAIYSSQDCKDDSYVSAMSQIISVVSNDDDSDTENIKNVSQYVDNVLDHALTIDVESIVSPQYQDLQTSLDEALNGSGNTNNKTPFNFAQTAVDYVSRIKSSISIGKIDTSAFETVTSRVQIDSDYITNVDDLKAGLEVYDCGAQIKDFSLKKIDYTGSNIMLLCDVSGSMGGSIQNLRDAVVAFIQDKNASENLAVVTFDSAIVDTRTFGTTDEELIAFAQSMQALGGTDMFSAAVSCLGSFPSNDSENNVLILMTDGQDNDPKSTEEISRQIGSLALQKGVTVYAMGLGSSVDTVYLNTIANSGNGEFVYVSDSSSLSSFYNMLHSQVYSQYEISYKAQDTVTMTGRTLEVSLPSERVRDVKTYSLVEEEEETDGLKASENLSISGMSPRYIYKGLQAVSVKLKGTGFKADSSITVKLNGNIDYTVKATYADEESYDIEIPASVAVGVYNVEVTVDGKKKVLQNGFSVLTQGDEKTTEFGPYVFTSSERIESGGNSYTLRGNVTLNGWLHFKGDVTLQGDLTSGSISVYDGSGSYVTYDKATAEGIGSFLAEKGITLDIPALYGFTLYNDAAHIYDYSNYLVDDISTGLLEIYNLVCFDSPVVRLYPNSIGLYFSTGNTVLPYQKQILKNCGNTSDMFMFSFDGSAQVTNTNVGLVMDASYKDPSNTDFNHQINLLNSPVYFNGSIKVKINTLKNEYTLGAMVRMAFFAKESGIGAEISWKGHLVPDSVKLSLELAQAVKLPTAIPIEVNNFTFKVSDINTAVKNGAWTSLKFTGSASFSSLKVKEYIPALEKFVGNVSLLEMPDTTASIRVCPFTMEASATLKFLSEIKLAEAGVKLGNFDYTNSLLQLDNVNVNGLSASLKEGLMWNTADGRVSIDVSGTGELDAHTRFVGVTYDGTMEYDISWWIINTENRRTGSMALGLYTTHDDKKQLVFACRYQSKNKVKGCFYYIDEKGKCGKNNGMLN